MTAAHVLMDPFDSGYGAVRRANGLQLTDDLNLGVIIPTSPAYGARGLRIFPFEKFWVWGNWKESPLVVEKDQFELLTDVAICKIANMPNGAAHQPLSLSLNPFVPGEDAYSVGYSQMKDVQLQYNEGSLIIKDFEMDLYVSTGEVISVFEDNHQHKSVSTPGPCFDFQSKNSW